MLLKKLFAYSALTLALTAGAFAEETPSLTDVKGQVDGMNEKILEMDGTLQKLAKLKVSGYMQVEFNKSEALKGLASNPYDSADYIKGRFRVRRSRLKFTYDEGSTSMVVQADYSNTGFEIKDAYLEFNEKWLNCFKMTAGIFNRPNYEVEYSSSQRESMERSAVVAALYPKERDLGMMITATPEDWFKFQFAAFNNTFAGDLSQTTPNFGSEPVYYMARITKSLKFDELGIDFGAHVRMGNVVSNGTKLLESDQNTKDGVKKDINVDDTKSRTWFGGELQLYYDFLGGMKLMGEYITGTDYNVFSAAGPKTYATTTLRERKFSGFYAMFVKNIGDEFQFAAKYDSYNPNTKISDDKINTTSELTKNTIGLGLHNYTFPNVRISLWYDMPKTKEVNNSYLGDFKDPKDNLLTVRFQYKF